MKTAILTSVLVLLTGFSIAQGQSKYRITAFKAGDNSIVSVSNEVTITPDALLYFPNIFTPNKDGLNDSFGPIGEGIEGFSMKIYNRWGELIFESADINYQWDGSYKGEVVQEGTYVYDVFATSYEKGSIQKSGSVTLIN